MCDTARHTTWCISLVWDTARHITLLRLIDVRYGSSQHLVRLVGVQYNTARHITFVRLVDVRYRTSHHLVYLVVVLSSLSQRMVRHFFATTRIFSNLRI